MDKLFMEQMLSSEMNEVKGGLQAMGTCVCENGGAGSTVVVIKTEDQPSDTILV